MSSSGSNIAKPIALVFGAVYLFIGVFGFAVTGFTGFVASSGNSIAGLHLNGFHNVVHLGIGLILIIASRVPDATITQGVMLGVGLVYVAATLLGFLGELPILAITTAGNGDNFLHVISALVLLFGGLAGAAEQREADAAFDA